MSKKKGRVKQPIGVWGLVSFYHSSQAMERKRVVTSDLSIMVPFWIIHTSQ